MIFDFLKRPSKSAEPAMSKPRRRPRKSEPSTTAPADISALEVSESADSGIWAVWNSSVALAESQLGSARTGPQHLRRKRTEAGEHQEPETFARVVPTNKR